MDAPSSMSRPARVERQDASCASSRALLVAAVEITGGLWSDGHGRLDGPGCGVARLGGGRRGAVVRGSAAGVGRRVDPALLEQADLGLEDLAPVLVVAVGLAVGVEVLGVDGLLVDEAVLLGGE